MLVKITLIGIFGIVIINMVRQYKSEYAVVAALAVAISMMFVLLELIGDVKKAFDNYVEAFALSGELVKGVFKITSIAYVRKFGCDISTDFGYKIIADKIDLAARLAVVIILFPEIMSLYVNIIKLL